MHFSRMTCHDNKGQEHKMMTLAQHFGNHLFRDADITQLFLYWPGMNVHSPICYSIPARWREVFVRTPFKTFFSQLTTIRVNGLGVDMKYLWVTLTSGWKTEKTRQLQSSYSQIKLFKSAHNFLSFAKQTINDYASVLNGIVRFFLLADEQCRH